MVVQKKLKYYILLSYNRPIYTYKIIAKLKVNICTNDDSSVLKYIQNTVHRTH